MDRVTNGILIVEALAQTGGVLLFNSRPEFKGKFMYFASIDEVRFKRPVFPEADIRLEVELAGVRQRVVKMRGRALVDGQVVTEADLTAMVVEEKVPG